MKKLYFTVFGLMIVGIVGMSFWFFAQEAKADIAPAPYSCRRLSGTQRENCIRCVREEEGFWTRVPIPVIFNATVDPPPPKYHLASKKLADITRGGHCIHNLAILIFMIFYLALALMAVVAVFMLMFGGYQYLTSLGNAERTRDAKVRIFAAIGGLVLGLLSFIILQFINPDLLGFRWGDEFLRRELAEAMKRLQPTVEPDQCPKDKGEDQCRGKKFGDLCNDKTSIGGKGYCSLDPNVEGCVCYHEPCANNCTGTPTLPVADPDTCIGQKCVDLAGQEGVCIKVGGQVQCLNIRGICSDGKCGATAGATYANLDCREFYPCKDKDNNDGYCLGNSGAKKGEGICVKNEDICMDSRCGQDYGEYHYYSDVVAVCHGRYKCKTIGDNKDGACLNAQCIPYVGGGAEKCENQEGFSCDLGGGTDWFGVCAYDSLAGKWLCVPAGSG